MRTRITALVLALLLLLPLLAGCGAGTGAPDGLITGLVEEGVRQGMEHEMAEDYDTQTGEGDTDGDGAPDAWEEEHRTDPESPDELFAVQEECEGEVMSAAVSTHTEGAQVDLLGLYPAGTVSLNRNVPGWLGDAFEVSMIGGFTEPASICIQYDEGTLPEGADPVIYWCGPAEDGDRDEFIPLETTLSAGKAVAAISENGTYALMDRTIRNKVEEALR